MSWSSYPRGRIRRDVTLLRCGGDISSVHVEDVVNLLRRERPARVILTIEGLGQISRTTRNFLINDLPRQDGRFAIVGSLRARVLLLSIVVSRQLGEQIAFFDDLSQALAWVCQSDES
jgi:hypothetical protein